MEIWANLTLTQSDKLQLSSSISAGCSARVQLICAHCHHAALIDYIPAKEDCIVVFEVQLSGEGRKVVGDAEVDISDLLQVEQFVVGALLHLAATNHVQEAHPF